MLPNANKELSAGILAGGKSSRFGSPKGLQKVGDKSMIETAATLAAKLSDKVYLSIGAEELYQDLELTNDS